MFFEVIDFVSMAVASKNFRRLGQKGGWYRVAWAFLKLVDGKWRSSRFGNRVRLQLFRPSLRTTSESGHKDAWKAWKSGKRSLYPGGLNFVVNICQHLVRCIQPLSPSPWSLLLLHMGLSLHSEACWLPRSSFKVDLFCDIFT